MSENAPGQLLGFALQLPRALCHLLRGEPGCVVCLEVHGDVSTQNLDGRTIAEEDKSSIVGNPVTDKSTDLWKTFSNWVNSVKTGEFDADKTKFILYRNKGGRKGIAEDLAAARTSGEVAAAISRAKEKLSEIEESHPIWEYYKNCMIDNESTFAAVVLNFELETGEGAGFIDVEMEVVRKHVPASQIKILVANLNGWLSRVILDRISERKDGAVSWAEFDNEFRSHFLRARRMELIDFALTNPPTTAEISDYLYLRPRFVQQVELINCTDDEIIGVVTEYLKAQINRNRWIEDELINEELAADFEEKLVKFWRHTHKKISLTNKGLTNEERGQLLLSECSVRQETIGLESPPADTIAGTYHALANSPKLGWHSDWKAKIK
ncbi:ABC-three component system protein [Delftia lacustris]